MRDVDALSFQHGSKLRMSEKNAEPNQNTNEGYGRGEIFKRLSGRKIVKPGADKNKGDGKKHGMQRDAI